MNEQKTKQLSQRLISDISRKKYVNSYSVVRSNINISSLAGCKNISYKQISDVIEKPKIRDHSVSESAPLINPEVSSFTNSKLISFSSISTQVHYVIAVFLVLFGLTGIAVTLSNNKKVIKQIAVVETKQSVLASVDQSSIIAETTIPSEDTISDEQVAAYDVPSYLPKYLKINSLQINSRIKQLGLKKDNSINNPSNIYDVGWYNNSSLPGQSNEASLIVGHVHGPTAKGVFINLNSLKTKDKFEIVMGNNQVISYEVINVEQLPLDGLDMTKYLVGKAGESRLTLMTCAGDLDDAGTSYKERLAVTARKVY